MPPPAFPVPIGEVAANKSWHRRIEHLDTRTEHPAALFTAHFRELGSVDDVAVIKVRVTTLRLPTSIYSEVPGVRICNTWLTPVRVEPIDYGPPRRPDPLLLALHHT